MVDSDGALVAAGFENDDVAVFVPQIYFSVDFKNDQFSDELLAEETFAQTLTELESAVRKQSGDPNFTLPK